MTPTELLDHLDALQAAATGEGPWAAERIFWKLQSDYIPDGYWWLVQDDAGTVAALTGQDDDDHGDTAADRAALIVAAVNALPQLTAALRAALAVADQMRQGYGTSTEFGAGANFAMRTAAKDVQEAIATALTPAVVPH